MLIVELQWLPFGVAALTGLLALAIFVAPRVIGSRSGLVIHRLRSSRPPSEPLLQRYYLDVALMALGGLVFWELQAKGQIVSGGLFQDVRVNEALLLAPVLYLTVVALVFLRLFPLFVRFISGESPLMLHLAAGRDLHLPGRDQDSGGAAGRGRRDGLGRPGAGAGGRGGCLLAHQQGRQAWAEGTRTGRAGGARRPVRGDGAAGNR